MKTNNKIEYVNEQEADEVEDDLVVTPKSDEAVSEAEKKFTQADLERMIGERLARDRKKQSEESEKQRLLDEAKYKELYEASEAEKVAMQTEIANAQADQLKTNLIVAAGYPVDKVEFIKSIVSGSDEAEIIAALDIVMKNVPPTPSYVDPNPGNGHRVPPTPQADSDYGKSLYDRIKKK